MDMERNVALNEEVSTELTRCDYTQIGVFLDSECCFFLFVNREVL